jgi:hypothetical protein
MRTKRQYRAYLLLLAMISANYLTSTPSAAQTRSGFMCRDCPFAMHTTPGGYIAESWPQALLQMIGYEAPQTRSQPVGVGERSPVAVQPSDIATRVLQTEILKVNAPGAPLVIVALGQLKSGGWTGPILEPVVYAIEPSDGIYDFVLYATPPSGPAGAVMSYLTAVTYWPNPPEKLRGVRIRSATNAIVALLDTNKSVPELPLSLKSPDYKSWIGKRLVRANEQSSGDESVVKEIDLPKPYRIFSPDSPYGDMQFDPQRLNVFIDEKMTITAIGFG